MEFLQAVLNCKVISLSSVVVIRLSALLSILAFLHVHVIRTIYPYCACVSDRYRNGVYSQGAASNFRGTLKAKLVNLKLLFSRSHVLICNYFEVKESFKLLIPRKVKNTWK